MKKIDDDKTTILKPETLEDLIDIDKFQNVLRSFGGNCQYTIRQWPHGMHYDTFTYYRSDVQKIVSFLEFYRERAPTKTIPRSIYRDGGPYP